MVEFRDAERKKAKLRLGISAPAGAGKTMGALLLAYGIIKENHPAWNDAQIWAKIALIDTEEGSGELYVGSEKYGLKIGKFKYCRISAPFTVAKYIDALHTAERMGMEVIIEDSISHAWDAAGGLLEKKDNFANQKGNNSYTAWRFVTPEHNNFIDSMLQSPAHVIATMRSKTEYVQEKDSAGKTTVRKIGMAPVQRSGMEYEFTVVFDISFESVAHATKDRTDLFSEIDGAGRLEKKQFIITPDTGRLLFNWLNTGADAPRPLEAVAAELAAEIKASTDMKAMYAKATPVLERMRQEKPEWATMMVNLMNKRYNELNPQAQAG